MSKPMLLQNQHRSHKSLKSVYRRVMASWNCIGLFDLGLAIAIEHIIFLNRFYQHQEIN